MKTPMEVPLNRLISEVQSGFASGEDVEHGLVQVRMNNVTRDGKLDFSKVRRVPAPSRGIDRFLLEPGDILFNATNSPDLVGKSCYVSSVNEPIVFSNHFMRLRCDRAKLNGRFLVRLLHREFERGLFKHLSKQWVNQATVSRESLLNLKVPLPPLSEQQRIANVLDQADALRAKRRETLAELDELIESTFLDMFGSPDGDWPIVTVSGVALDRKGSIRTGPFGSQLLHEEFVDSGVPVLGIDNVVANEFRWAGRRFITEQKYRRLERYRVYPGDVLITIMGTCGRCAIVPSDVGIAINTKHLCCITLDQAKCKPEFLQAYFLRHPVARHYLARAAKGAIMSGLNMGIIKALPIHLPPLDLQREFARRVEAIERMKETQRAHLAELDALFASLQDRAFRGEL